MEVAHAVDGVLTGDDVEVDGVAIDSRLVTGGELFVPVVAERDGHQFVAQALDAGAAAYLCSQHLELAAPSIRVADTGAALLKLGRHARSRIDGAVIGITGSVGKTTVKDLCKAALAIRFRTHASPRSFNNELGVPLTLATAADDVEAVVVEMGARGRGHIAQLCEIARPNIAVVTTVALAHAEMFGTIEDVAVAKRELIESLPPSGTAVLNADNPFVLDMAGHSRAEVVTFGLERPHDVTVTATRVTVDEELFPSFTLRSPWGQVDVRLAVRGAHQVMNALAAAAAAMATGVTPTEVAEGLAHAALSPWRMDLQRTPSGALVLNDSYNANPTSVEAALRSLAALPAVPAGRKLAVLGVMAELGPDGPKLHREVAALAQSLGISVIAVDAPDYGVDVVTGLEGALAALGPLSEGDAVLVKGSRVAGLERLAAELVS